MRCACASRRCAAGSRISTPPGAASSASKACWRDRRAAALAAFQGGRGELGSVLEAERAVTETELALVQALAERAKAWASLNYVYPQESGQ